MKIVLAAISSARTPRADPAALLAADYIARARNYTPCEPQSFETEAALLAWLDRAAARTAPVLILLDSTGRQLTSPAIAAHIGRLRDSGAQTVVLAIGPHDGWSPTALARAGLVLSLGPITLPHTLARAVLAEQVYRALTILAGHPYHSGH